MTRHSRLWVLAAVALVLVAATVRLLVAPVASTTYAYLGAAMVDSPSIIARDSLQSAGIEARSFLTGRESSQALLGGAADFATMAEWPFLLATKSRKDLRVIALIAVTGNMGIVADRDEGIAEVDDLRGKTVGLPMGTTAQFLLEGFIQSKGLSLDEISPVPLPPLQLQPALERGDLDAIVVWQPHLERAHRVDTRKYI